MCGAVFAASGLLPARGQSVEGFVCVTDMATGFKFDPSTKRWRSVDFAVSDNKYILARKGEHWTWKPLGSSFEAPCDGGFNEYGFLRCGLAESVSINRKGLRFQSFYGIGYVHDGTRDSVANTPSIEIGRCSPM